MTWLKTAYYWTDSWLEQWHQKPARAPLVECAVRHASDAGVTGSFKTHVTHIVMKGSFERWKSASHFTPTYLSSTTKISGHSKSLTVDPAVNSPFDDPIDMATGPCVGPILIFTGGCVGLHMPTLTHIHWSIRPSFLEGGILRKQSLSAEEQTKISDFRVLNIATECNITNVLWFTLLPQKAPQSILDHSSLRSFAMLGSNLNAGMWHIFVSYIHTHTHACMTQYESQV